MRDTQKLTPDHRPKWGLPSDGQLQWHGLNEAIDRLSDLITVFAKLWDRRPIVVSRIEIIPRHLIDANCTGRFDLLVDSVVNQLAKAKFVDIEDGSVAKVEHEWMSKLLWLLIE